MSEQTDQIKTDVEALSAATTNATDWIAALTNHAVNLSEGTVTDEQFTNLHNALVDMTNTLNEAVTSSQEVVGPIAQPRDDQ